MIPLYFPGHNIIFGKNQEGIQPLPAIINQDGRVITCWQLTDEEIEIIKKSKCLFIGVETFNQPLQPLYLQWLKMLEKLLPPALTGGEEKIG